MNSKSTTWLIAVLIIMGGLLGFITFEIEVVSAGTTLYVGGGGVGNYSSIQWAIDNASTGDTVFVYNGTYSENLFVNITINLIGEDRNTTLINGGGNGDVVYVGADWVNITGFYIYSGGRYYEHAGIKLNGVNNCSVFGNNINSNRGTGIFMYYASNNRIENNYISHNDMYGIHFEYSDNNNFTKNIVYMNDNYGIVGYNSLNNYIAYNNISQNEGLGIGLSSASNFTVFNNDISLNENGMRIYGSNINIMYNNISSNNNNGLEIRSSSNTSIGNNNILNNSRYGIGVHSSRNINISMNIFANDGITITGYKLNHFNTHYIPDNNLVNGKPLFYHKNLSNTSIDGISSGQLILANCTNVEVRNLNISDTDVGIELGASDYILLESNIISNSIEGIYVYLSTKNSIENNEITKCQRGIYLTSSSDHNILKNNNIFNNSDGISIDERSRDNIILGNNISNNIKNGLYLYEYRYGLIIFPPQPPPPNNTISNNVISFNGKNGIYLYSSNNTIDNNLIFNNSEDGISISDAGWILSSPSPLSNNTIINNNLSGNGRYGIYLDSSPDNYIANNHFVNDGLLISGYDVNHVISNTISDNMVNGKPLYYYKNRDNLNIDGEQIGQLILANCTKIRVENLDINNTDAAIELAFSNDVLLEDNSFNGNLYGIYLFKSSFNTIKDNDISTNDNSGIYLSSSNSISSSNNTIESNNILSNGNGLYLESFSNDNKIKNNNISENKENGIYFSRFAYPSYLLFFTPNPSTNNLIEDNNIVYNGNHGICLNSSLNTSIINNNISTNSNDGVSINDYIVGPGLWSVLFFTPSWKNNFVDNFISGNGHNGITITISSNNSIIHNMIINNGNDGIAFYGSLPYQTSFNNVTFNNITNNSNIGIRIYSSSGNNMIANNISYNGNYGFFISDPMFLRYSINNTIYHNNFIDNINQAYDGNGNNFWNDTYPSAGNYWSDYTGLDSFNGPGQNLPGSDGIGDSWYVINSKGKDFYPLMHPWIITTPEAPQNLTAFSGDSYVNLLWDPPVFDGRSPITNYKLYKGTSSGGESYFMDLGNVLFYNDTSVTKGVTYFYQISAENDIGEGQKSNEANVTPSSVPSQPLNLWAMAGNGIVNLTWNIPSDNGGFPIMNYTIFRGTTSGGEVFLAKVGNISYYNDNNVTNGNTYYYIVSAENTLGESPFSNEVTATPGVPTAPRSLVASSGDTLVKLTWSTPTSDGGFPITNYRIYKGTSPGGKTFLAEVGIQFSYDDTNVTNEVTYFYEVSAVNSFAEGPMSNEVSAKPGVPTEPKSLTIAAGDSYLSLSWNPPDSEGGFPITNYIIYRGTTSDEETFLTEIGNILNYNDTDVSNGIRYYYKVSAKNVIGEGPLSKEVSATPGTIPSAPFGLVAQAGDSYVKLDWEVPSSDGGFPITNYRIYRGTESGSETVLIEVVDTISYNDTSVSNGITYYYTVSAVNNLNEGPMSNEVEGTPLAVPSEPTSLTVMAGDSYVNLTWNAPNFDGGSPITGFCIYRGTSPQEFFFLEEIGNITFYNDTTVINDLTYYYKVSSVNIIGKGSFSDSKEAKPSASSLPPNQLPTCSISSLSSGATITGIFEVSGSAFDADGTIQNVEIRIDDGEWMRASGTTSWTYTLDTTSLTNGEHGVYVRSYDGENYSQEENVNVIVNNHLPSKEKSIFEEGWFWFFIIAIIIVAIVIVFFLMKMRKKPTEDMVKEHPKERENEA